MSADAASASEAPLVFETPGGLSVSMGGRLLYSGREPERLPRRLAAACDRGPGRLHLVASPLLWYGVGDIAAAMGKGSSILCVEAEPALALLARESLPPELAADGRIAFIASSSVEEILTRARALGSFRSCALTLLSGGASIHEGLYRSIAEAINRDCEAEWRNLAALMALGPRWARNVFDNIAALPEMEILEPPRLPAAVVVCGAGPSLEASLEFLREERERLSIVACDTAIGTLLASGIQPDIAVCLEGQAHNLPDFTCLGARELTLVADLSSHPATFRVVKGPKCLSLVRITRSPFLERVEAAFRGAGLPFLPCPPLGSVGVHAYHIARELSTGPIFLTGLDFSFEPGKTHARGCPSILAEERRLGRLGRWKGQYAASYREGVAPLSKGGRGLLSDPILLSYAALLEDRISRSEGSEILAYDLRGRGPDIGGRPMGLSEASALVASTGTRQGNGSKARAGSPLSKAVVTELAISLIRGERRRLDDLCDSMHGSRPLEKKAFLSLVRESDYLWWGFPDQRLLRGEEVPQDLLNRLVPQVEAWAARLEALEATLSK